ncbi:YqaJ viral recombinase family protein [Paraburkholderia sacchari]|uniref:YqaJ viral recombinase family protein n=1 Tax=Paraburkholderia sacchari TaxID=159450 RepID=UPI001BD0EB8A|nr:YqaJ viral recombinase family protein [Paraburkholderia sacchari]
MIERITHDLEQGSPEWMEFRLKHFGASEAAAMLGLSPHVKRNELLHMKHTGTPKEFSDWVQEHILDKGHEVEALTRPIVEEMLGEDLYPMVFSLGRLSASCDGVTMLEDPAWENKQYNEALYASIGEGVLPEEHMPQAQQILLVTGATRLIFTCSDGTENGTVWMEVLPDEAWFEKLRAGWAQFAADLAAYQPRDIPPQAVASPQESLPAPFAQVTGNIAIRSNLDLFGAALRTFIERIPDKPETDQEFADTEAACKRLKDAEDCLAAAEDTALASVSDVEQLRRVVAELRELARQTRLAKEKMVDARKKQIKESILLNGRRAFSDHIKAINLELVDVCTVDVRVNVAEPDFAGAIKGKRTLASLHEAVDTALANGKIAADAAARELRAKLDWYVKNADQHDFLFRDLQALIQKPAEDFKLAVTSRIAEHKRQEDEKEAKRKADEAAAAQRAAEQEATRQAAAAAQAAPESSVAAQVKASAPAAEAPRATAPAARAGRIPRPTAAQIIDVLADHYGATPAQTAALLVTLDFKAELKRLEATA